MQVLGRWFAWQTLVLVPVFPELRGCSQVTAFRDGEWDVGGSLGFAFLGPMGNCSWKTNSGFFSRSSFALVSSQLLPLNLPFPQRVLLSSHPFILSPSSLPSFPLSPAPVHARGLPFKASLLRCHYQDPFPTHPPQQKGSISQFAFCRA